jgi:hypothetical protein
MSILKCPYLLQTVESMPRAKLKTGAARVFPAFSNENNASCALCTAVSVRLRDNPILISPPEFFELPASAPMFKTTAKCSVHFLHVS